MRTLTAFRTIPRSPEDDNGADASAFGEAPLTADFDERESDAPEPPQEPEDEQRAEIEEPEAHEPTGEPATAEAAEPEGVGAPEPEQEAPKPKKDWRQARIDKLVAEKKAEAEARKAAEERAAALEALYGDKEGQEGGDAPKLYTEAEVQKLVQQRAHQQDLNARADKLFDDGAAKFKDWTAKLAEVNEAFGPDLAQRPDLFDAITKLPNAADVYYALGSDLDQMAHVLELNPVDLGMELKGLSEKLAKPKPQPISRAPAPIKPLDKNNVADMPLEQLANDPSPKAMAEFDRRMRLEEEKRWARR